GAPIVTWLSGPDPGRTRCDDWRRRPIWTSCDSGSISGSRIWRSANSSWNVGSARPAHRSPLLQIFQILGGRADERRLAIERFGGPRHFRFGLRVLLLFNG